MNYRHAYHAGNFADVMKHTALVAILRHLQKKDTPFAVIDTHAGAGLYERAGIEAQKTGEAAEGIGRLDGALPRPVADYVAVVGGFGTGVYPGSPLIAARLLRPQDRLVAIEKEPGEFAALKTALHPYLRARVLGGDGYAQLMTLLPPPERRGLVLIDPPYEADDESARLAQAVTRACRRWPTGIYLVWFPVKSRALADALAGDIGNAGIKKILLLSLAVGRKPEAPPERLSASGLLVVNPPFGLAGEMQEALAFLAVRLAQGEGAGARVEWLTGGE